MNVRISKDQKVLVNGPEDIYPIMRQILLRENKIGRNKEHFWVIGLANDNRILFIELVSLGSVNAAIINPSEVFQFAIQKLAVKVILVHNHPSGNLKPSVADKDITDRLIQAGRLVEREVIEHLIISPDDYFSFVGEGIMNELRLSKKYALSFLDEQDVKLEMAKGFYEQGFNIKAISKASGLTEKQIKAVIGK